MKGRGRFYLLPEWHGRGLAQMLMTAFYRKCSFVDVGAHVFMVARDAQTDRIMSRPVAPFLVAEAMQAE